MNHRKYKTVETLIHAWVLEQEFNALGRVREVAAKYVAKEENRPYLPLTPLRSQEIYWDSQFTKAS